MKIKIVVIALLTALSVSCQNNATQQQDQKKQTESQKQSNPFVMDSTGKKTDEEWKKILSPEQYAILRLKETERPWTGKFNMHFEKGKYVCAGCGLELFSSESKFESHCGWPAFDDEIKKGNIKTIKDTSHGMVRTEILCGRCGGHLGHVFDDGPTKTGVRYCVNSASLDFKPEEKK
jgi:peptide-methionine (R)-S-oxide reductase